MKKYDVIYVRSNEAEKKEIQDTAKKEHFKSVSAFMVWLFFNWKNGKRGAK
jgi:hypothetical protein